MFAIDVYGTAIVPTDEQLAYHEAGHVVMAYSEGVRMGRGVTIDAATTRCWITNTMPTGDVRCWKEPCTPTSCYAMRTKDRLDGYHGKSDFDAVSLWSNRDPQITLRRILLAGMIASHIHLNDYNFHLARGDRFELRRLGRNKHSQWQWCVNVLTVPRAKNSVKAVARALIEEPTHTLWNDRATQVIESVLVRRQSR